MITRIKNNPIWLVSGLLLVLTLVYGCNQAKPPANEQVIARVGNSFLTLEQALRDIPSFVLESDSIGAIQQYRDNWIRTVVIHKEAIRNNLHRDPLVKERLENNERQIIREIMREAASRSSSIEVSDIEVRDYYNQHRDQFVLQERYLRVRHVVTETLDESRDAKTDLLRGVGWETVVERYAINKEETLRNAELFFPESSLFLDNPLMQDYLRLTGITEISPIRGVNGQFHFIQIMEDRAAGSHPELDWVFDQIRSWLEIEKRRRTIRIFEQNLMLQAEANNEIEVFDVITVTN